MPISINIRAIIAFKTVLFQALSQALCAAVVQDIFVFSDKQIPANFHQINLTNCYCPVIHILSPLQNNKSFGRKYYTMLALNRNTTRTLSVHSYYSTNSIFSQRFYKSFPEQPLNILTERFCQYFKICKSIYKCIWCNKYLSRIFKYTS